MKHTYWQRLESSVKSNNFDRSLQCEVRDPLWMLTRQWQMGEFLGEDNGSPAFANIKWQSQDLQKISLNGNPRNPYRDNLPLEAIVETVKAPLDLFMRVELGRHWFRLLKAKYNAPVRVIKKFKASTHFQFELPDTKEKKDRYEYAELLNDSKYLQTIEAIKFGQMIDGGKLYEYIISPNHSIEDWIDTTGENIASLNMLLFEFVAWFDEQTLQPQDDKVDAWEAKRLEYRFDLEANNDTTDASQQITKLRSEEYFHGRLDWYAFDIQKSSKQMTMPAPSIQQHAQTLMPASVEYPGMPHARWWEFEDSKVSFGNLKADTTELSKLAFAEFGLIYSNDWFILPVETEVGALLDYQDIIVTDVFGQRKIITHYKDDRDYNKNWRFFQLHDSLNQSDSKENRLLIPSVAVYNTEGKPIEKVNFIRDELANMAWGIEEVIPDELGNAINGKDAAIVLHEYFQNIADPAPIVDQDEEAKIRYQIATTVPENWIPFIPKRRKSNVGELRRGNYLQRAAMPRIVNGYPINRVRPRTPLLRKGIENKPHQHYFIFEEEVPRSGVTVSGSWQRTRWYDGKVVLWYGYRKATGKGEGQSNLMFDQIKHKERNTEPV